MIFLLIATLLEPTGPMVAAALTDPFKVDNLTLVDPFENSLALVNPFTSLALVNPF